MKKTMLFAVAAAMLSLTACGPSKEELARREKAKQDSIQHVNDSMAVVQKAVMQAEQEAHAKAQAEAEAKEKARQDSIAQAEKKHPKKMDHKKGGKKKK
jgi:colicin import membrane protein